MAGVGRHLVIGIFAGLVAGPVGSVLRGADIVTRSKVSLSRGGPSRACRGACTLQLALGIGRGGAAGLGPVGLGAGIGAAVAVGMGFDRGSFGAARLGRPSVTGPCGRRRRRGGWGCQRGAKALGRCSCSGAFRQGLADWLRREFLFLQQAGKQTG